MGIAYGRAVPYDEPTVIPGMGGKVFKGPSPFGDIKTLPTVTAQKLHSVPDLIGSTASGTLRLTEKPDGLYYEIDLPANDPLTAELVARGDLAGASFAFSVPPGGDKWDLSPGGMAIRIISKAVLYEVSLVGTPAYPTTTAMMRAEMSEAETAALLEAVNARIARIEAEDAERDRALRETLEVRLQMLDREVAWDREDAAWRRRR